MRVMETADIWFSVNRHKNGGNKAVRFSDDAAFLYGKDGVVPVRQRGSKARLAFVTVWAWFDPDCDREFKVRIECKEVRSFRVQANLHALKLKGYAPYRGLNKETFVYQNDDDALLPFWDAYSDLFDELEYVEEAESRHVDNVWIARLGHAVVRDEWHAIATAVVMLGDGPEDSRIEPDDLGGLVYRLGTVVA